MAKKQEAENQATGQPAAAKAGRTSWLDAKTVVGVLQTSQGDGDMALVQLDRPTRLQDLGFRGFFVGVVQS